MPENGFSSKELFALDDNGVPPFISGCFIGLITPFEEMCSGGQVPSRSSGQSSCTSVTTQEPPYPVCSEFKKDWIEWICLELKVRLEMGVRYYNFRGDRLSAANRTHTPIILFMRKFRRVDTKGPALKEEAPSVALRAVGASQLTFEVEHDTLLRGQLERRFSSYPVLWIANPTDALSLSGYLTRGEQEGGYELNKNSIPFILSPMWAKVQRWQEAAEYLIRASDAIVIANISKEGGVGEEQELIYAANAMERTFVTHPEYLATPHPRISHVNELTEEKLHSMKGADQSYLGKLAGWGHWSGLESMEYARQYIGALDELWGAALDSGSEISPGYFAALFTALMALLVFRGEFKKASKMAQFLAAVIATKSRGESVEFLRGPGEFHSQDVHAVKTLVETSQWYAAHEELYRTVAGLSALEGMGRKNT